MIKIITIKNKMFFLGLFFILLNGSLFANSTTDQLKLDYYKVKNELNLDNPNELSIENFTAELYLAYHIYNIDKVRDINEEFQFGKDNIAKLIKYKSDYYSGFNAGIYVVNNNKIIVSFGGTGAKETYDKESFLTDIITDLSLITLETGQVKHIKPIMEDAFILANNLGISKNNISVSGHSLGGGLAQYASMLTGVKAVTLNTAPNPINAFTMLDLLENGEWKYGDDQITNIMVENDILTSAIIATENKFNASIFDNINPLLLFMKKNKLVKLIYGNRIFVKTGAPYNPLSAHKSGLFLETSYSNITDYTSFKSSYFVDVPLDSLLSKSLLELIKNHSISYPKEEREYKFYPNVKVSGLEISIFLVNTFLYEDFRKEQLKNNNLTRLTYLNQLFLDDFNKLGESDFVTYKIYNNLILKIFEYTYDKQLYGYNEEETIQLKNILLENMTKYNIGRNSINNISEDFELLRGQVANLVIGTKQWNWNKLIYDTKEQYHSETLKQFTGKGHISIYMSTSSIEAIKGLDDVNK